MFIPSFKFLNPQILIMLNNLIEYLTYEIKSCARGGGEPNATQLNFFSMEESNIIVINSYWNLHQIKMFINSVENYRVNANNGYFDQKLHSTLKFKSV